MRLTARDQYIDIIERQYFGNMSAAKPDRILPLLFDNATLTGFFGANDARIVRRRPGSGEESFEYFLGALHAEFALAYSHFVHFVDLTEERCACTFQLEIAPRDPHFDRRRAQVAQLQFSPIRGWLDFGHYGLLCDAGRGCLALAGLPLYAKW